MPLVPILGGAVAYSLVRSYISPERGSLVTLAIGAGVALGGVYVAQKVLK